MVQFRKRKSDGQSFPVGNNKKIRASNPSNDVGGIKLGSGTKVPERRSEEERTKQLEEFVIPQLGRSISALEDIKNNQSDNVVLRNDLDAEIDILLDIKNEVKKASTSMEIAWNEADELDADMDLSDDEIIEILPDIAKRIRKIKSELSPFVADQGDN